MKSKDSEYFPTIIAQQENVKLVYLWTVQLECVIFKLLFEYC